MDTITSPERRLPGARFLLGHPARMVAFVGGIGLIPFAPGTFGTLAALPMHAVLATHLDAAWHGVALLLLLLVGVWACGRTNRDLGVDDHGGIVFDETVAFLVVLYFTPPGPLWQAFAFLLFRLFDIAKPPPIGHFDRTVHGGFGVMLDDVVAAGYALLCLAVWKALFV